MRKCTLNNVSINVSIPTLRVRAHSVGKQRIASSRPIAPLPPRYHRTRWSFPTISPSSPISIGRVGVGWQRRRKTCLSLRELGHRDTVFFSRTSRLGGNRHCGQVGSYGAEWRILTPRASGMIPRSAHMVRRPRQIHRIPIAVTGNWLCHRTKN